MNKVVLTLNAITIFWWLLATVVWCFVGLVSFMDYIKTNTELENMNWRQRVFCIAFSGPAVWGLLLIGALGFGYAWIMDKLGSR